MAKKKKGGQSQIISNILISFWGGVKEENIVIHRHGPKVHLFCLFLLLFLIKNFIVSQTDLELTTQWKMTSSA